MYFNFFWNAIHGKNNRVGSLYGWISREVIPYYFLFLFFFLDEGM